MAGDLIIPDDIVMKEEEDEIEENGQKIPSESEDDKENTNGDFSLINRVILKAIEDSVKDNVEQKTLTDGRCFDYVPRFSLADLGNNYFDTMFTDNEKQIQSFLSGYLADISQTKFQSMAKSHKQNMIFPGKDGNCLLESIKNGLLYGMNLDSTLSVEDKKIILGKTFTDMLEKYGGELRNLSTTNFPALTKFGEEMLATSGVVFNIFQYSEDYITTTYQTSNQNLRLVYSRPPLEK